MSSHDDEPTQEAVLADLVTTWNVANRKTCRVREYLFDILDKPGTRWFVPVAGSCSGYSYDQIETALCDGTTDRLPATLMVLRETSIPIDLMILIVRAIVDREETDACILGAFSTCMEVVFGPYSSSVYDINFLSQCMEWVAAIFQGWYEKLDMYPQVADSLKSRLEHLPEVKSIKVKMREYTRHLVHIKGARKSDPVTDAAIVYMMDIHSKCKKVSEFLDAHIEYQTVTLPRREQNKLNPKAVNPVRGIKWRRR